MMMSLDDDEPAPHSHNPASPLLAAQVESLMLAFYKQVADGFRTPDALARASRQAASSAAHNFVCIGAFQASSSRTAPVAAAVGGEPSTERTETLASKVDRPQATQPFQWGAPSGV